MKTIFTLILLVFLAACTKQVTKDSAVTATTQTGSSATNNIEVTYYGRTIYQAKKDYSDSMVITVKSFASGVNSFTYINRSNAPIGGDGLLQNTATSKLPDGPFPYTLKGQTGAGSIAYMKDTAYFLCHSVVNNQNRYDTVVKFKVTNITMMP